MSSSPVSPDDACAGCARPTASADYENEQGAVCLRCLLADGEILRRSMRVAVVVGTALVLLNQGDRLLGDGAPGADLWWKIPLTYCVPFCVATYGALGTARRS